MFGKQKKGVSNRNMVWRRTNLGGVAIFPVTLLILAGVLFLSLSCSSGDGESTAPVNTGEPGTSADQDPAGDGGSTAPVYTEGPRISFDQDFVYLGEATPEQLMHYEFLFQNVGNAPLIVYDVSARTLQGC